MGSGMTNRPETKEEWLAEFRRQGMPEDEAAFAAAIEAGEIDGDVIENDDLPEFLRKRGINHITDNVPPGHLVRTPADLFWKLFDKEAIEELQRRQRSNKKAGKSD